LKNKIVTRREHMKKTITVTLVIIMAACLMLAACSQPAAEAPSPSEEAQSSEPAAATPAPAEETPAPTQDATPEPSASEAAEEPSQASEASAGENADFLTVAGKLTYDDVVAEFGESDTQNETTVDDIDTLAVYYRNNTMWFKKDGDKWILDGTTIWRPSSPYTVSGVQVAMPTGEAVSKLEGDGFEFVDGEVLEATSENFSIYQKKEPTAT
jgi:hypothetical protein